MAGFLVFRNSNDDSVLIIGDGDEDMLDPLYTTGRLTLVSGNAVPITDQIAKGTLYYTSIANNGGDVTDAHFHINISDGAALQSYDSAEISIGVSIASGEQKDVFIYSNAGTPTLEFSAAWTDDDTRSEALSAFLGQVVKDGAISRRFVGTIRASGTDVTEDSGGFITTNVGAKRFVYNAYNKRPRGMGVTDEDSWSNTSQTIRPANNDANNRIEWVSGDADGVITATLGVIVQLSMNVFYSANVGMGLDTTSAFTEFGTGIYSVRTQGYFQENTVIQFGAYHRLIAGAGIGHHSLTWLESGADGACTFVGANICGIAAVMDM